MKKLFPPMHSRPKTGLVCATAACWLLVFVFVPMWLPFIGLGIWETPEKIVWLEIVYHTVNGMLMYSVLSTYIKDEWFMVTTDPKFYIGHAAVTAVLMVVISVVTLVALAYLGLPTVYMLEGLPIVELTVALTPSYLIDVNPIFGTLCVVLAVPFSVTCLYYAIGFAPVCTKYPWLAYVSVALVILIPPLIDILWRGGTALTMGMYMMQLPVHLLACWSYQKTDNIFTPILSVMMFNLLICLLKILPQLADNSVILR